MAWSTPRTWVTDEVPPAATWNTHVRDQFDWLGDDKPAARVYNSANISTTTATIATLTFDSERFDAAGMHSTSVNTDRLTVPSGGGGKYLIGANIIWANNGTGYRALDIRLNGSTLIARDIQQASTSTQNAQNVTTFYALSATDYVTVEATQNSGGNLNVEFQASYSPEFWAYWVQS